MKKRKRILATILVFSMLMAFACFSASATYAIGVRLWVYQDANYMEYFNLSEGATLVELVANATSGGVNLNDDTNGYWLYTLNGELGVLGINQSLESDDVVAVYQVPTASYSTATFAKIDDTTAIIHNGVLIAKENLVLKGEIQNFDMTKPYVRDTALSFKDYDTDTATTTVTNGMQSLYISGTGVLPTVIPVETVSSYAAYGTEVNTMLAKLTATAYMENNQDWIDDAEAAAEITNVDTKADAVIALGQTIYDATRSTDKRLAMADFGSALTTSVPFDADIYNYTLEAADGTGVFTGSTVTPVFTAMDSNAAISVSANNDAQASNGTWTLEDGTTTFTVTVGGSMTYTFTLVKTPQSGGSSILNSVGYLPVGQFATGAGWGSFYSDDTNVDGSIKKFSTVSSTAETGVSLGAAGGYIEFNCTTPITNSSTTPYGIDFIVYGNAFNGNPEAAAVKVYGTTDGTNYAWYQLAGSHYYDSKSKNSVDVTYKKVTSTDNTFDETGIWYKVTKNNNDIISWTLFKDTTAWWPEYSAVNTIYKNYGSVWGSVSDVTWNSPYDEITYKNVCLVIDTDTTNDYQFGYADVHINGAMSATPVNPYAITNTGTGGDGFDLSWAVNSSGEPVALLEVTKIRVYTAACLNSAGDAFTVPGAVGETSAEVCGIFVATVGTESVGTTDRPSVSMTFTKAPPRPSSTTISPAMPMLSGGTVSYINDMITAANSKQTTTYDISVTASTGDNVYINGVRLTESATPGVFTGTGLSVPVATQKIQILVQSGDAAPYIVVLT